MASSHWLYVAESPVRIVVQHITSSPLTDGFNVCMSNTRNSKTEMQLPRIEGYMEQLKGQDICIEMVCHLIT